MTLNNDSGITYYRQIADILIARIHNGIYKVGEKIPSGRELGKEFRCNRHTIRRALDLVESKDLIVRYQGRGTFVVDELPTTDAKTELKIGLIDLTHALGFRPSSKVLNKTRQPAGKIADRLKIAENEHIFYIHRLRLINDLPAIVEHIYIPTNLAPDLLEYDLTDSLRSLMQDKFDLHLARSEVVFESILSTPYISELLETPLGSAMMLEKRTTYNADETIYEYSEHVYRGDRFSFLFK